MRYVVDITQSFSIEMYYYFQSSLWIEIAVRRILKNFAGKDFCMRNSWIRKQYITLASTFACFPMPFTHRFYFICPNLKTVARIPTLNCVFFKETWYPSNDVKNYHIRNALWETLHAMLELQECSDFSQSITRCSEVCLVTTQ